ncbi:RDD family protein [Aliarcobacter lanthieri]|uniref:RDD family protein n=1 Tax=Aliarcobacter lanthieri TaxID=1355374 RepID=UPI003AA92CB4
MQENSQNLQLASMRSRAFAFVIDDVIVSFLIMFVYWDSIISMMDDNEAMLNLMQTILIPLMILKVIYHTFFVWYYGATIGKKVTKIRVIDANHWGRVTIFQSFLRAIGRVLSELFYYLGFIIGFFNNGRRTFHDFTGNTLVVDA